MPYTKEELKNNSFYQNLLDEDEQQYLAEIERLKIKISVSGSAYDGSLVTRDESGTLKIFENPYTGELYEDETNTVYATTVVEQLKDDDTINQIVDREIREL
tara:strand:+ start:2307 stop:2612 length:306 start_codon:yes stop_codon:yes gene_type:complete